jgi:hypothetical protein
MEDASGAHLASNALPVIRNVLSPSLEEVAAQKLSPGDILGGIPLAFVRDLGESSEADRLEEDDRGVEFCAVALALLLGGTLLAVALSLDSAF